MKKVSPGKIEKDQSLSIEEMQEYQKGDVFSFGVVLWEIITRQIPWNNLDYQQVEQSIMYISFLTFDLLYLKFNN